MSPRQARRERSEAERKAKKLDLKKSRLAENHHIQPRWNPELEDEFPREVQIRNNAMFDRRALELGLPIPPPGPSRTSIGFVSQKLDAHAELPIQHSTETGFVSQRRIDANRSNAQHSTGPTSSRGKAASSRNSTKHGLASGTLIIPGEDPDAFEAFLNDFLEEHQPATATEDLLIKEMAQSFWLTQRAIRFQNECFTAEGVDQKQLALFLRYQTTHQQRFHKALDTLLKLKKIGFVSQRSPKPAEAVGFVSQEDQKTHPEGQFVSQKPPCGAEKPVVQNAA